MLVLLPQVVLNGGGHDEVVALQGGPGEAVPLVHRGEGGDGGFGALRLGNARRAEGVVKDAGVEDEGGGDHRRCLWLLGGQSIHIHPQGHQLGQIAPLGRGVGEGGQGGQGADLLGAGGLGPGEEGAAQHAQGQNPGPRPDGSAGGQGLQPQGQGGAQGGQIEQQVLLPVGLHPGEQEQAQHRLRQGEQGRVPGGRPPEEAPHHAHKGGGHEHPAEVAAQHHRVHPPALVVGRVGVKVVGAQYLFNQEALPEEQGAHHAGGGHGGKGLPLTAAHRQGGQGCQPEGHGKEEEVPPQQEHQGEQGPGEDAAGRLRALLVGVDHKGPDAGPRRRHVHKAGESGVEQHGGGAGQQQAAPAYPPGQGRHACQGGQDVEVGNGEEVDVPPGTQHPHHQGDGPGEQVVVLLGDDTLEHQPHLGQIQVLTRQHGAGAPIDVAIPVVDRGGARSVEGGENVHRQGQQQPPPAGQLQAAEPPGSGGQGQHDARQYQPTAQGAGQPEGEAPDSHIPHGEEAVAGIQQSPKEKGRPSQQGGPPGGAEREQQAGDQPEPPRRSHHQGGQRRGGGQNGRAGHAAVQHGPKTHQSQAGQAAPRRQSGQSLEQGARLHTQPGGQVMSRPASTWKCRWCTDWPACSPQLETTRKSVMPSSFVT